MKNCFEQYWNQFKGQNVPSEIQVTVVNIMKRFCISGLCDGMYLANIIGKETGLGDGEGHFDMSRSYAINAPKIGAAIKNAYGWNIVTEQDMKDLTYIIMYHFLPTERMAAGLKDFVSRVSKEILTCDRDLWRRDYLYDRLQDARETIARISPAIV